MSKAETLGWPADNGEVPGYPGWKKRLKFAPGDAYAQCWFQPKREYERQTRVMQRWDGWFVVTFAGISVHVADPNEFGQFESLGAAIVCAIVRKSL